MISSQQIFYFGLLVAAFLVLLFSVRRGQKPPTKLNLRAGEGGPRERKPAVRNGETISKEVEEAQALAPGERSLNAVFNYNGHNFDAYEVLGLPAGARQAQVDEAYRRELAKSSEQSRDFIETAYRTLRGR